MEQQSRDSSDIFDSLMAAECRITDAILTIADMNTSDGEREAANRYLVFWRQQKEELTKMLKEEVND